MQLSTYEIIRNIAEESGGAKKLRDAMMASRIVTKMDVPVLTSWCQPPADFNSIDPIEKVQRLTTATRRRDAILWICCRSGYFFVHGQQHVQDIYDRGSHTWFECSLQIQRLREIISKAFLDNPQQNETPQITEQEAREIALCWAKVYAWISGFLTHFPVEGKKTQTQEKIKQATNIVPKMEPILFRTTHSYQILRGMLDYIDNLPKVGKSRKQVADIVACDGKNHVNALNKWAIATKDQSPNSDGSLSPLDYVVALTHASGSVLPLQRLAHFAGGDIHRPANTEIPNIPDLLAHWERTTVELAELDAAIARALLDQKITPSEKSHLVEEWNDVVLWMTGFTRNW